MSLYKEREAAGICSLLCTVSHDAMLTDAGRVDDPGFLAGREGPELDLRVFPLHVELDPDGVGHLDDVDVCEVFHPDAQFHIVQVQRGRRSEKRKNSKCLKYQFRHIFLDLTWYSLLGGRCNRLV